MKGEEVHPSLLRFYLKERRARDTAWLSACLKPHVASKQQTLQFCKGANE
jgi:hypothetical protein